MTAVDTRVSRPAPDRRREGGPTTRKLLYTAGSPFARAIRILLHELELGYAGEKPDSELVARADSTPTLQVPALVDGEVHLWESGLIAEYLLTTYRHRPAASPPLAAVPWREEARWRDKLVFSTIQTLGTAVTTVSQLTWTGVTAGTNGHLALCAERAQHILDWLEDQLGADEYGFLGSCLSMQDVFLASHVSFVEARPLGIDLRTERRPKLRALLERLRTRWSFLDVPIWWWDPDVEGYKRDGTPIYAG